MAKGDGKGSPPTQADIGKILMLRNDRGARYSGLLKALRKDGTAIILCFSTDYGGDWKTYTKPEHATVKGAEVLEDA